MLAIIWKYLFMFTICMFKVRGQKKWVTCVTSQNGMILKVQFHFKMNEKMMKYSYCCEICIMDLLTKKYNWIGVISEISFFIYYFIS